MRAWARLDGGVSPGTTWIDQRGLAILKAREGDAAELRRIATSPRPRAGFAEAAE